MKLVKAIVGALAAATLVVSASSVRADDYVYGNSSGILSGNMLLLNYGSGFVPVPLGQYSITLPGQLFPTINGDSGWFTGTVEEGPGGDNYVTGNASSVASGQIRSFLSFNTTGFAPGVLSAVAVLNTYSVLTTGTETVDLLGGVNNIFPPGAINSTEDANYLLSTEQNSTPAPSDIAAIYSALGTGPVYGSFGYTASTTGAIGIPLDASFLADINTALAAGNGLFSIGLNDLGTATSSVPGRSHPPRHQRMA